MHLAWLRRQDSEWTIDRWYRAQQLIPRDSAPLSPESTSFSGILGTVRVLYRPLTIMRVGPLSWQFHYYLFRGQFNLWWNNDSRAVLASFDQVVPPENSLVAESFSDSRIAYLVHLACTCRFMGSGVCIYPWKNLLNSDTIGGLYFPILLVWWDLWRLIRFIWSAVAVFFSMK